MSAAENLGEMVKANRLGAKTELGFNVHENQRNQNLQPMVNKIQALPV